MSLAIKLHPDLGLNGIYPFVWQPCLENLKQLLLSLSDLNVKLAAVDREFTHYENVLDTQLLAVFKGVTECTDERLDWRLIERAITKIRQYWELCRYRQGAKILLKIRESLHLGSGDFSLVEKLSNEVLAMIILWCNQ